MRKFKLIKEYPFSSEIGYICVNPIEDLSKFPEYWIELIEKTPIFVSADGKDLYEGDSYYVPQIQGINGELIGSFMKFTVRSHFKTYPTAFSTAELAKEYIDNNKTKYSLIDIENAYNQTNSTTSSPLFQNFKSILKKLGK